MIQPDFQSLSNVLNGKLFVIPEYQRHYSWKTKQRKDLFNDINKLIAMDDSDKNHFMATIVCLKTFADEKLGGHRFEYYDIVDGQQRLTTLVILLKAISLELHKQRDDEESLEEAKLLDRLLIKRNQQLIILQSNHDNKSLLRNYLIAKSWDECPNYQEDADTAADKNLCDAMQECKDFVDDKDVIGLLQLVQNQLNFVLLTLEDKSAVYTIFEVLNSRGLAVDWLDKCKSVLMGLLYEYTNADNSSFAPHLKELQDNWSEIYRIIGVTGDIRGDEIVRFTATLLNTHPQSKIMKAEEALEYIRNECKQSENPIKTILKITKTLKQVTKYLSQLGGREYDVVSKISQSRLLGVSILLKKGLQKGIKEQLLSQWETTSFKIYGLFRKDSRSKVSAYINTAKEVQKYNGNANAKDLLKSIASIGEDFDINNVDRELKGDCYNGWENEVRYFFYQYEQYLSEKKRYAINQNVWNDIWKLTGKESIEHIMPQNRNASDWQHISKQHQKLLHSIGNLSLLTPPLNSEAGDKDFKHKKSVYEKANINLFKDIKKCDQWTEAEIKNRTEELICFAKERWKDIV
jgi:hypothetical protein